MVIWLQATFIKSLVTEICQSSSRTMLFKAMVNEEYQYLILLLIITGIISQEAALTCGNSHQLIQTLTLFMNSKLRAKYRMHMCIHAHTIEVIHKVVSLIVFIYNLKCHKLKKCRKFKIVYTVTSVFTPDERVMFRNS
jgi:hypothetical protein